MFNTPILFLIFNRPDTTALVFEEIKKLQPKVLFVAADGARPNKIGEHLLCAESRELVINGIDWDCEMKQLFRTENLGCKNAVSGAIAWFFESVEEGIILEDDCVPDSSFFEYCARMLDQYRFNDKIFAISGTNMGYDFSQHDSYRFTRFMNMWGWATWRRSVPLVDYEMTAWKQMKLKNKFLLQRTHTQYGLDINWIKYWRDYFDKTASGQINTWDYQWLFAQLYHKKLSVFPAKNLIKNIGFTDMATHTRYPDHPIAKFERQKITFPLNAPSEIKAEEVYEENYLKKIWFGHNKTPLIEILKTKLLYIPVVHRMNLFVKKRNSQK